MWNGVVDLPQETGRLASGFRLSRRATSPARGGRLARAAGVQSATDELSRPASREGAYFAEAKRPVSVLSQIQHATRAARAEEGPISEN
jgi:hypothetical protein